MLADDNGADGCYLLAAVDGGGPGLDEGGRSLLDEGERTSWCIEGGGVERSPAFIVQSDGLKHQGVEAGEVLRNEMGGDVASQGRMVGLGDEPAIRARVLLDGFDRLPGRYRIFAGRGRVDGTQDHDQRRRALRRTRPPAAARAGPELEGGLRIPCSRSRS